VEKKVTCVFFRKLFKVSELAFPTETPPVVSEAREGLTEAIVIANAAIRGESA
jgi:hypothetical protein